MRQAMQAGLLESYLIQAKKFFPDMSTEAHERWARARLRAKGPKVRVGDGPEIKTLRCLPNYSF